MSFQHGISILNGTVGGVFPSNEVWKSRVCFAPTARVPSNRRIWVLHRVRVCPAHLPPEPHLPALTPESPPVGPAWPGLGPALRAWTPPSTPERFCSGSPGPPVCGQGPGEDCRAPGQVPHTLHLPRRGGTHRVTAGFVGPAQHSQGLWVTWQPSRHACHCGQAARRPTSSQVPRSCLLLSPPPLLPVPSASCRAMPKNAQAPCK